MALTDVVVLRGLLAQGDVLVIGGAGCSTASGIPDYRGDGKRAPVRKPILHAAFRDDPEARRRYWARAYRGWPSLRDAVPNPAHRALAALEAIGQVQGLITQNVDELHEQAGSQNLIALHGVLSRVICLGCGTAYDRELVQRWLAEANPHVRFATIELAPDGDAEVDAGGFAVPGCPVCQGVLKPDVTFFGDNVPRERVEAAYRMLDAARAVLVVGSSLTVFSGYRFVKRAHERGLPIGIVNLGPTRGDALATVRVTAPLQEVLPTLLG